jgi:integrase/recombinase XerD
VTITQAIEQYCSWKRANGYQFFGGLVILRRLRKYTGEIELSDLRPEHLLGCLNQNLLSNGTWTNRYWVMRRFLEYCTSRNMMSPLDIPPPKVSQRKTFAPYIFTTVEIRLILDAIKHRISPSYIMDQPTLRAIIVLLYATGLPVGEVCILREEDVDLCDQRIRVRSAEAQRDRLIPIGPDLCEVLREYKVWRAALPGDSPYLFVTRKGRQSNGRSIAKYFQELRRTSGVHRRDDSHLQPRVSDLRFTFAVHQITKGIENGDDLNRLFPALAAYMGQVGLGATARYLALTPGRFRRQLDKLSPQRESGNWRDDPGLLMFLDNL